MTQNTFRILVVVAFFSNLGVLIWSLVFENATGHEELDQLYQAEIEQIFSTDPLKALILLGGLVLILLLQLIGMIGLLLFYSWGRYVYCISLITVVLTSVLAPYPILQSVPLYLMGYAIALIEGAILLAMWTEPLKSQFRGVSKEAL